MDLNQQRALVQCNPMDVMANLIEKGIITTDESQKLDETRHEERVSVFLSILKQKGSESFSDFIEALDTQGYYRDLAEKIKRDEELQKEKSTVCERQITQDPVLKDDPFMFLDFVSNIAELLKRHEVLQLCEHFQFESNLTNQIRKSTFPGLLFTIACRRRKILSSGNTSHLQNAFDTLGMTHLSTIAKEYMEMMRNPEFNICIESSSPPSVLHEIKRTLSTKISSFRKHRLVAYFFREKYKANLDSIKDGSLFLVLRTSRETLVESLKTQVLSGELAKDLLPILLSGPLEGDRKYETFNNGDLSITLDHFKHFGFWEKVTVTKETHIIFQDETDSAKEPHVAPSRRLSTDCVQQKDRQKNESPPLEISDSVPNTNISTQKEGRGTIDYQIMRRPSGQWNADIETDPNKDFVCGQGFKVVVRCKDLQSRELIDIGIQKLNFQNKKVREGQETEFVIETYGKFTIIASVHKTFLASKDIFVRPCDSSLFDCLNHVQPYDALLDCEKEVLIVLKKNKISTCSPPRFEEKVVYTQDNFIPFGIAILDSSYFVTVTNQKKVNKFNKNFYLSQVFGHKYLTAPTGITAMEKSNQLFVANKCEKRDDVPCILIFDRGGQLLKTFAHGTVQNPWSVKINYKDELLVSDASRNCIYVFTSDEFTFKTEFKIPPYDGQEMQCRGMDVDRDNNIFVAERGVGCLQQFECISIYTVNFDTIGHICCSMPEFPRLKRFFLGIPKLGIHIDSIVEDATSLFRTSSKKFHFVRGISNTVYQNQAVLLVVDSGNDAVRMISLSKANLT